MTKNFSLTTKEIETLVKAGGMAPSGGNTQPWLVKAYQNKLEIKLDPKRSTSFIDVGKTSSVLSLGCFVENVEIAVQKLNLACTIKTNFDNLNNTIITILFSAGKVRRYKSVELYPFIAKRVTNRQLYDGTIIPEHYVDTLKQTVHNYNPSLKLTTSSQQKVKMALVDTLGRADVIRMTNRKAYSQMVGEFRWTEKEVQQTRDGLDLKTLELPRNLAQIFKLIRKYHSVMKLLPKKVFVEITKPIIEGCSHICCLSTSDSLSPEILFETGRVIERIWLMVTKQNIAFQPWTISTFFIFRVDYYNGAEFSKDEFREIKEIRNDLQKHFQLSDEEIPLFIFRISRAKKPTARSLRRDWREFVEFVYPQK